ncbi:hypothetical protein N9L68_04795 [bacterium]|nr:hypothetical protein [bacterium]
MSRWALLLPSRSPDYQASGEAIRAPASGRSFRAHAGLPTPHAPTEKHCIGITRTGPSCSKQGGRGIRGDGLRTSVLASPPALRWTGPGDLGKRGRTLIKDREACTARPTSRSTRTSATRAGKGGACAPHSWPAGCKISVGACRRLGLGGRQGRETLRGIHRPGCGAASGAVTYEYADHVPRRLRPGATRKVTRRCKHAKENNSAPRVSVSAPSGDFRNGWRGTEQPQEEEICGKAHCGSTVGAAVRPRRSVKVSLLRAAYYSLTSMNTQRNNDRGEIRQYPST